MDGDGGEGRGQSRKGEKVRALQTSMCQWTRGRGQRSSLIIRETQVFADWLVKVQQKQTQPKWHPKIWKEPQSQIIFRM